MRTTANVSTEDGNRMDDSMLADLVKRIHQTQREQDAGWERRVAREEPAVAIVQRQRRSRAKKEEASLRRSYAPLFDQVLALLGFHDPVRISYPPEDMFLYTRQVRSLIARIADAQSAEDIVGLLHQEFTRAFGSDAGPEERYHQSARDIWRLVQRFREDRERRGKH
jgi:hypothetical protein